MTWLDLGLLRLSQQRSLSTASPVEGRNLVVEARYAEGRVEKYPPFADELVSSGVDLIAAFDSQAVDAARLRSPAQRANLTRVRRGLV